MMPRYPTSEQNPVPASFLKRFIAEFRGSATLLLNFRTESGSGLPLEKAEAGKAEAGRGKAGWGEGRYKLKTSALLFLMAFCISCSEPESPPAETKAAASTVAPGLLQELALLHRRELYEEGLVRTRNALQRHPKAALLHHNLGVFLASLGEYEQAIPAFEEALSLRAGYTDSHRALATAYTRIGELDSSVYHFEQCVESVPDDPLCTFQLGRNLSALGLFEDALSYLRKAAQVRRDADAQAELATTLRRLGDREGAIEAFAKALQIDPNHLVTLLGYGQMLMAEQRVASGKALLDRHRRLAELQDQLEMIERSAKSPESEGQRHLAAATIYVEQGRLDKAIAAYRRAAEVDSGNPLATLELAHLLLNANRLDEAELLIEQAQRADRGNPGPLFFRGLLQLARGHLEEAGESFSASQRLGGWPPQAYLDVGIAYASAGISEGAIASYSAALELDDTNAETYFQLARAHYERGERELAATAVSKCLALDPKHTEAWFVAASLRADGGDMEGAEHAFEQGLSTDPELLLEHGARERIIATLPNDTRIRDLFRRLTGKEPVER